MKGLTPGRIVHFINDTEKLYDGYPVFNGQGWSYKSTEEGAHVPAIVTAVIDEEAGEISLSIFYPGAAHPTAVESVLYDESATVNGTWHWIEQA